MHPMLTIAVRAARKAGNLIAKHYETPDSVEATQKGTNDFVTNVDREAEHMIIDVIRKSYPKHTIISEECGELEGEDKDVQWIIDPLDGTKEFISGSEEFTVNIALIEQGRVVFGVVSMPTSGRCYYGGAGLGAWRADGDAVVPISVRNSPPAGEAMTVVASRRHSSPEQERLLAGLSEHLGELKLVSVGSSLKFCLLAEGAADCYPRLAPTSQWDTAAAQGVLEGAGGVVLQLDGEAFSYPARESLLNQSFLALPAQAPWREKLLDLAQR